MFDLHGYGPSILQGTLLTIEVSLASLLISMLLGILGALAKLSPSKPLQLGAQTYTTIIRGIPDLVLMLLVFFGGQVLINQVAPLVGYEGCIDINPFMAGVSTIGFIFGAYMTETFRGAILAVPKGQIEAACAYGMTKRQTFMCIPLPPWSATPSRGSGTNWPGADENHRPRFHHRDLSPHGAQSHPAAALPKTVHFPDPV